MIRNIIRIFAILLLIAGITVILYPHVMQFLYARHARGVINDFEKRMEEHGDLEWLKEKMVEYNIQLYENGQDSLLDPFYYDYVSFSLLEFGFDEEMIGFITIPRMDVELPIYLSASDANMRKGAVHLTHTSLPVGGENTNTVIAAHRGMSTAAMFRNIHHLEIGDRFSITNFYETLYYEVVETRIILPTEVSEVKIQSGRELVTLISCHPLRHNHQRILVFAERVID